jgi:tetratricopeptide (TPR) repeat protein
MSMDPAKWTEDAAYLVSERAYLLHTEGRYQESLALFEGLLDIYPDDLYYRDAVSALHLALGQPEEAVRQASLVIDSEPTYANAFVRRCEGYLLLGMSREAERDLEQLRALPATGHVRRMEMRLMAVRRTQLAQGNQRIDE